MPVFYCLALYYQITTSGDQVAFHYLFDLVYSSLPPHSCVVLSFCKRKGTPLLGGCSCAPEKDLCHCWKAAYFKMFGFSWGGYAVVYIKRTWKPNSCGADVDTGKLQATEACIKSICGEGLSFFSHILWPWLCTCMSWQLCTIKVSI